MSIGCCQPLYLAEHTSVLVFAFFRFILSLILVLDVSWRCCCQEPLENIKHTFLCQDRIS